MESIYIRLQNLINLYSFYIKRIFDFSILLLVCRLCGFSFWPRKINMTIIKNQCIAGLIVIIVFFIVSSFFIQYTTVYQDGYPFVEYLFYQIICIGFFEEFLFRGIFVKIVCRFCKTEAGIILLNALIFTGIHIGLQVFSMIQIIPSFLIGLIFTIGIIKFPKYFSIYSLGVIDDIINILVLGFSTYMLTL